MGAKANPPKEKDKLEHKEENKCKKIDSSSPACLGKARLPFVSAKAAYKQKNLTIFMIKKQCWNTGYALQSLMKTQH